MRCALCKGEVEEQLIRYVQEVDEHNVVIVENVPAEVCTQCGETFIRPEVARKIQRIAWEQPPPKRTVDVPVYDLAEVV